MNGKRCNSPMFDLLKRFRLFFTSLFFLLSALLILTLQTGGKREISFMEKVFMQISFPIQKKTYELLAGLKSTKDNYLFLTQVQKENEILKSTLSKLREENNRLREAILADKREQKLYDLQASHPFPSVLAQVIVRDPSNWFQTFLVNKGEKEGVSKDMAVLTSEGVVGRVIESSPHIAKILLITDPNSALDVIVQNSRSQGILEGKMEEVCILKYVNKTEKVETRDTVITSGLGGIFPKGLKVGTVNKVERRQRGIFQYIEVTPAVNFSQLEEVLILRQEP